MGTKKMAERDYYEVLGVPRSATQEQIRAAYRKLARELHPDVNKAADAQEKFAEVQAAYDVLGEPEKRAQYDRFGRAGPGFAGGAGEGAHYTWTNVGSRGAARGRGAGGGADFDLDDLGSMFDAFFGGKGASAGASAGQRQGRPRGRARPTAKAELDVSFMTMARGGVERVPVRRDGKPSTVEVTIPRGIVDGTKLRIPAVAGGTDPDLILTVRVGKHPLYRRVDELDMELDLPLNYAEAALGAEVAVPTLEGRVYITIPPGARSGKRFRLRGRGLKSAKGETGDLYAVVHIIPPPHEALQAQDRAALERLAALSPPPRATEPWSAAGQ